MKNLILFCAMILNGFYLHSQNIIPSLSLDNTNWNNDRTNLEVQYTVSDKDNSVFSVKCILFYPNGIKRFTQIIPSKIEGNYGDNINLGSNKFNITFTGPILEEIVLKVELTDNEPINIANILKEVDEDSIIYKNLLTLQGRRHHTADPVHLNKSRIFLENYFNQYLKAETFISKSPPLTCINYVADQYGMNNPEEIYVVDAHYDGVGISPGADDNGSGVVGVLEAMRILSKYSTNKTIRYALFDLEELGLVGSNVYLSNQIAAQDNLKAAINFEMIGYYSNEPNSQTLPTGFNLLFPDAYNAVVNDQYRGNFITNVGNVQSSSLITKFQTNAAKYSPLKVISLTVPGKGEVVPDLRRSDHAAFWDRYIPALMLTDGANFRNKRYHTASDSIQYLDFNFMKEVIKVSIATLAELSDLKHASAKQITISGVPSSFNESYKNNIVYQIGNTLKINDEKVQFPLHVELYNLSGERVYTSSVLSNDNISLDKMINQSGIYYCKIFSNKFSETIKISYFK